MEKSLDWTKIILNTEKDSCKGLIFRGYVTQYMGSNGTTLNEQKGLKLLKRKSCNMCSNCGYDFEDIKEFVLEGKIDFRPIENGKLYTLQMINWSTDWETGAIDDWDYEIVEVIEGKIK